MFTGTLFEPQKEAAQFICAKKTAILAGEQGTGKTVITIASAERLRELQVIQRCLILAPSAIAWQWPDKVEDFTDDASATLIHAKSRYRGTYETPTPYTVTSYNLFRRDFATIARQKWDLIACDEAQEFKNNNTKTAKLLKQLNQMQDPLYKWAITGTVISNKLEELYSIMYWVDSKFLPPWPTFEKLHIIRNPKTQQIMRYKNVEPLSKALQKRMIRKTQEDMGDAMPESVPVFHYIEKHKELKDAEHALLDCLDELADITISGGGLVGKGAAAASQAFHAVKEQLASEAKLKYMQHQLVSVLAEHPENRVVVFSHFKQPLYDLGELLSRRSINYQFFTGDQSSDAKRKSVLEFKKQQSVLLCSDAGKAGLDLPFANYLYHVDVPFSYEVFDQRNKRITRIGSKFKTVKVNYVLVKDSFEEYYYRVVKAKEKLSNAVYYGETDTVVMKTQSLRGFLNGLRD